jgi:hypothetical protein
MNLSEAMKTGAPRIPRYTDKLYKVYNNQWDAVRWLDRQSKQQVYKQWLLEHYPYGYLMRELYYQHYGFMPDMASCCAVREFAVLGAFKGTFDELNWCVPYGHKPLVTREEFDDFEREMRIEELNLEAASFEFYSFEFYTQGLYPIKRPVFKSAT